jgi:hypothetical protein
VQTALSAIVLIQLKCQETRDGEGLILS